MAVNEKTTGWVGWIYFAALMLVVAGVFQLISGLMALLSPDFYKVTEGAVLVFSLTTWGWVHLVLGILLLCVGTSLFYGKFWSRVVAVILAVLNLIAQFAFLSEYPLWSFIIIAVDVLVIYALTVHGREAIIDQETGRL